MCLLNGDVGGALPAPTRFDSYVDSAGQGCRIGLDGGYDFSANLDEIEEELAKGF